MPETACGDLPVEAVRHAGFDAGFTLGGSSDSSVPGWRLGGTFRRRARLASLERSHRSARLVRDWYGASDVLFPDHDILNLYDAAPGK